MPTTVLKIAFIGAGQVNFGGGEGPWDHATRVEQIANHFPLIIVGLADPFVERAQNVLNVRKNSAYHQLWKEARLFEDYRQMLDEVRPDAVFIGTPPLFHGSLEVPRDIELQCLKRNIHMFIEKPISCAPVAEIEVITKALQQGVQKGLVISVGYMFRYSKAVLKMKELINKYGAPRAFNARYNCAYTTISKHEWWDKEKCGGPIVEQATHFCDLARFLVGEVNLFSIQATALNETDSLGQLSRVPNTVFEQAIPIENRIPRVMAAFWRFESGAVGSLMHGVLLHEIKYESELEIWGDGYRLVLIDPYHKCQLSVRLPGSDKVEVFDFGNDDYYLSEDRVFIESIANKTSTIIYSPYEDAANTYKLTMAIRDASEVNK